ncbi:MAG: molybdopterin-dependent oxidoreductase, partial [Actinomycetota bacterium]|nr:molybdopterin-dependent oxidoreductase [Actinomycetota bacterium]
VATAWGVSSLPAQPGRSTDEMLAAAATGRLRALVVGGVEVTDLSDPAAAVAALDAVPFLVSLEIRASDVTERANVVFPVAAVPEKAGSFLDWEGRVRSFDNVLHTTGVLSDLRVLAGIAEQLGSGLGFRGIDGARTEMAEIGPWDGARVPEPSVEAPAATGPPALGSGEAVLATWRLLVDDGRLQDGDAYLKATARAAVALVSQGTATALGLTAGGSLTLSTAHRSVAFPAAVADLPDGVVWAPLNSAGISLHRDLGARAGDVVRIEAGVS